MITHTDPDETMPVRETRICEYHKKYPREQYAGCTCSASFGSRAATPEEAKANRLKRLTAENKDLLAKLDTNMREMWKLALGEATDGTAT